ncbi:N-acetylglucosaminyldiphosphodolichol N-acetylglucosaminyltransferase catalytic subunit alg13 [Sorochytrium milnesiophthora]
MASVRQPHKKSARSRGGDAVAKAVFVTVGTTRFDAMVDGVLSPRLQSLLVSLGYTQLSLQHGRSPVPPNVLSRPSAADQAQDHPDAGELHTTCFAFKSSLAADMQQADLVISHAGSGSILEALRLRKPLLVVVNDALMDNHQSELAIELHQQGYLISVNAEDLADGVTAIHLALQQGALKQYPARENTFAHVMQQVVKAVSGEPTVTVGQQAKFS